MTERRPQIDILTADGRRQHSPARRRLVYAILASLMIHALAAAALQLRSGSVIRIHLATQTGPTTINLQAAIDRTTATAATSPAPLEIRMPSDERTYAEKFSTSRPATRLRSEPPPRLPPTPAPSGRKILPPMPVKRPRQIQADLPHFPNTTTIPNLPRAGQIIQVSAESASRQVRLPVAPGHSSPASSQSSSGVKHSTPRVLANPAPVYPAQAMAQRQTGRVLVRVEISAAGNVISARVLRTSGFPLLDRSAVEAVRQWRFSSKTQSGDSPRRVNVPIDFVLRRNESY